MGTQNVPDGTNCTGYVQRKVSHANLEAKLYNRDWGVSFHWNTLKHDWGASSPRQFGRQANNRNWGFRSIETHLRMIEARAHTEHSNYAHSTHCQASQWIRMSSITKFSRLRWLFLLPLVKFILCSCFIGNNSYVGPIITELFSAEWQLKIAVMIGSKIKETTYIGEIF